MLITDKKTGIEHSIDNYDGDICAPDYMRDIIGNTGNVGIKYNEDEERYEADMQTIQWWIDYVDGMRDMTDKYERVLDALSEIDEDEIDVADYRMSLADAIGAAQGCDYESHADSSLMAVEDWIDKHVSKDSQESLLQLLL